MARFKIYSKDGTTIRYEGAPTYHGTYLNPSYLEFSTISSPVPIAWEIGDYVEYTRTGLKYELYSIPQPTKKATRDKSGESFVYSNVQLYDFTKMLDIAPFRDLVLNGTTYYFSSTKDFSTYENLEGIANRIKRNMNDFAGSDLWDVKVAEGLDALGIGTEDPKEFSVSGVTCLGALTHIYEVWDTIGWSYSIENGKYVITIGAPNIKGSGNTTNKYQYGYGNGLTAIRKTQTNISEMVTRLFVYGSTKNMIEDYYRGLDIYQKESVNIPNLMLPTTSWGKTDNLPDASKAYLEDASAKEKYGLIPKTIYFDGSDEEEIYPTIEGATIGDVKTAKQSIGSTEYVPTGVDNTQRVDVVAEVTSQPEDAGITGTDGSKYVESADITSQVVIKDHVVATRSDNAISDTFTFASHTFSNSGRMRVEMGKGSDEVFVIIVRGGIDPTKYSIKVRFGAFCGDTQVAAYREAKLTKTTSVSEGFAFYYSMSAFSAGTSNIAVTGKVDFKVEIVFTVLEFAEYQLRFASQESHFSAGMENILTGTFGIRIRQVGFDVMKRAALAGQSNPSITFNSGKLAGRAFTIASSVYDSTSDTWVLSINRAKDDSTNMTYPNTNYPVAVDDRFVFTDIAMPEEYIAMASARLLAMGQKYLEDNCVAMPFYEPSIDSKKVWENIQANPGQEQYILREGKYMHIKDADMTDGDEYVIIDSLTINEGESNIPTYSATLRDEKVRTLVQTLNSKINRLGNKGGVNVVNRVSTAESSPISINGVMMYGNQSSQDLGLQSEIQDAGSSSVPVYFKNGTAKVVDGIALSGNISGKNVSATEDISATRDIVSGRDVNSSRDITSGRDITSQGSVVGIHGVSAGGISDPTSEGGGGATYNVVKSSDIDGVNTEYTDTIPTAYALNVVKKMVTKEVTDRNTAISEAVSSEESARESEISRVEGLVSDESTARSSADATLQSNISAEATARSTADTTLQTNINSEASARSTADSTLQTNINNEATARSTADTTLQANIDTEAEARASADTAINTSLDKVEDNVGTSVAIYDAESKRFVLSGVSLNPRSLTNCRYVFKMDKAVTELPESRSSAILSIGGFVNGIKWRGKNATPSNTWEEGAWVDAWYYDGSWYMTYANTRVSYEIWGEETIIVKPTN